jgi:hypothetical protein
MACKQLGLRRGRDDARRAVCQISTRSTSDMQQSIPGEDYGRGMIHAGNSRLNCICTVLRGRGAASSQGFRRSADGRRWWCRTKLNRHATAAPCRSDAQSPGTGIVQDAAPWQSASRKGETSQGIIDDAGVGWRAAGPGPSQSGWQQRPWRTTQLEAPCMTPTYRLSPLACLHATRRSH